MTRRPGTEAVQQPAVAVRKLVESKAIRETSLCVSLLLVSCRFTGVNLLIPLAHHRGDWFWEESSDPGGPTVLSWPSCWRCGKSCSTCCFKLANDPTLTAEEMQRLIDRADSDKLSKARERLLQAQESEGHRKEKS